MDQLAEGQLDSGSASQQRGGAVGEVTLGSGQETNPSSNLWRDGTWTLLLTSLTLAANLLTGILIARVLGTVGRGQFTAISTPPQLVGWAFAMGCAQAVSFHQARHPKDGSRLISTWALMLVPLSFLAVVTGKLLLPVLLHAQATVTLHVAENYILLVVSVLFADLFYGLLLGDGDFLFYNIMRAAQPSSTAVAFLIMWWLGLFSLTNALLVSAGIGILGLVVAGQRAIRRWGIGRPSKELAATTAWYGARAHGTNLSGIVTARLDLLIIPAFLAASTVGLYAVATAVSGVVMTLSAALAILVLPTAAKGGEQSIETVIWLARATFLLGIAIAVVLGSSALFGIPLVYGASFKASIPIMWLLLPGTVAYATAAVLLPALYAANRPLLAATSYFSGFLVTLPGLLLFLRPGGLVAAAIVSSLSYGAVLVSALLLYSRVAHRRMRDFLPTWSEIASAGARLGLLRELAQF